MLCCNLLFTRLQGPQATDTLLVIVLGLQGHEISKQATAPEAMASCRFFADKYRLEVCSCEHPTSILDCSCVVCAEHCLADSWQVE